MGVIYNMNIDAVIPTTQIQGGSRGCYEEKIWNPVISESVNKKPIELIVDGKSVKIPSDDIYMDEKLNMMISIDNIGKYFDCASNLYEGTRLVLKRNENKIEFVLNSDDIYINEKKLSMDEKTVIENDDGIFVKLELVAKELNYDYDWQIDENKVVVINNSETDRIVPYAFDLREEGRNTFIKNQGRYGTCWAFASLTALATTLMPEEVCEFSPDHMTIQNSFSASRNDGGEYTMATAYLTAWQGPVFEKDDPYGDGISDDSLKPQKHVQEVQIIAEKNYEGIKEAIYKYGGVQSSLYTSLTSSSSRSVYYNREKYAYCYKGPEQPNHDIVIIGWDDNYPKENFNMQLEGNGAFICQNSWGESFGDNGIFYVSYYDVNIGIHNVVYTRIEDVDNYDNIYQSDLCGWVGQLGYGSESVYFANVYTANSDESINAAGFYATGDNTKYEIYCVSDFEDKNSLKNRKYITKGSFENAGFYTVDFDAPVEVKKGEKFAIIIYIYTPNSIHPAAIEYYSDESTKSVDISDGEGYISLKGNIWDSVEELQNCNLCLKVYTRNR